MMSTPQQGVRVRVSNPSDVEAVGSRLSEAPANTRRQLKREESTYPASVLSRHGRLADRGEGGWSDLSER